MLCRSDFPHVKNELFTLMTQAKNITSKLETRIKLNYVQTILRKSKKGVHSQPQNPSRLLQIAQLNLTTRANRKMADQGPNIVKQMSSINLKLFFLDTQKRRKFMKFLDTHTSMDKKKFTLKTNKPKLVWLSSKAHRERGIEPLVKGHRCIWQLYNTLL